MTGFSIAEVFTESLRFLLKHIRVVLLLALLPYGLLFAAELVLDSLQVVPPPPAELPNEPFVIDGMMLVFQESGVTYDVSPIILQTLLAFVLNTVIPLPFKVAWLRYSLLGPQQQPVRIGYRFGDREIRFLGYTLGLYVIMFLGASAVALVALMVGSTMQANAPVFVLFLAGIGFLFWLLARLFFVFPALAMDLPGGLPRAWAESRGQAFKLILLTGMISVMFLLPGFLVGQLLGGIPLLAMAFAVALSAVMDAALWTALGFAYWKTTGIPGAGAPTAQAVS